MPFGIEPDMAYLGVIAGDDLDDIVRLVADSAGTFMRLDEVHRSPILDHNKRARCRRERLAAIIEEAEMKGTFDAFARSDADDRTVDHERAVELIDRIAARVLDRTHLPKERMS